jgi:hypothetical protein
VSICCLIRAWDSREARPGSPPLGGPEYSQVAADRQAFCLTQCIFTTRLIAGCDFERRVCNTRRRVHPPPISRFVCTSGIFIYNCNLFLARDDAAQSRVPRRYDTSIRRWENARGVHSTLWVNLIFALAAGPYNNVTTIVSQIIDSPHWQNWVKKICSVTIKSVVWGFLIKEQYCCQSKCNSFLAAAIK